MQWKRLRHSSVASKSGINHFLLVWIPFIADKFVQAAEITFTLPFMSKSLFSSCMANAYIRDGSDALKSTQQILHPKNHRCFGSIGHTLSTENDQHTGLLLKALLCQARSWDPSPSLHSSTLGAQHNSVHCPCTWLPLQASDPWPGQLESWGSFTTGASSDSLSTTVSPADPKILPTMPIIPKRSLHACTRSFAAPYAHLVLWVGPYSTIVLWRSWHHRKYRNHTSLPLLQAELPRRWAQCIPPQAHSTPDTLMMLGSRWIPP